MNKIKKTFAIVMAMIFVLVLCTVSAFASTYVEEYIGNYRLYGEIVGDKYFASGYTSYSAPNAICAVELFEIYTDYSYSWLAGDSGSGSAYTSAASSGSIYVDYIGADHHFGENGNYYGVRSTCTED